MVNFCIVFNCSNRGERDQKSFHRIPAVLSRGGPQVINLSKRRREKWISSFRRDDLTENLIKNGRVCGDHFITGKPAELWDHCNPDWVPNQKMGYIVASSQHALQRPNRTRKRQKQDFSSSFEDEIVKLEDDINDTEPPQQFSSTNCSTQTDLSESDNEIVKMEDNVNDTEPPQQLSSTNCSTQTDLSGIDIENLNKALEDTVVELTKVKEKLKKFTLDEKSLRESDDKTVYFCGMQYVQIVILFETIKPFLQEGTTTILTRFQKFLLTLMHLRLNLDFTDLGCRFGISKMTASHIFSNTLNIMHQRFNQILFWPERKELMKKVPVSFLESFGRKVTTIIDCFEIKVQKPSHAMASAQFYSQYKHHHTIKYLIGISPQGFVMFISKAYEGRTTNKHVVQDCGILEKLMPGDVILADCGFNAKDEGELYCAEIKLPASTGGKKQLSAMDIENTRNFSRVRIHVERVIGRLRKKFKILNNVMPVTLVSKKNSTGLSTVDEIVFVCCCLVNILPSDIPFDD